MSTPRAIVAVVIALLAVALVTLALAAGWLDDEAKPGTTGRVPVTAPGQSR